MAAGLVERPALIALTPGTGSGVLAGYSADVAAGVFSAGGNWTLAVPGGSGIGAFSTSFVMPPAVTWTNFPADGSVALNQNLTVQYNSGSGSQVTIEGSALTSNGTGGAFICAP